MKKQLLALAVAGAIAAPAMAQNVTVYGTLDFGIGNKETSGANVTNSKDDDNLGSSVFGFKVTEDLGGGLKAMAVLESGIMTGNGNTDDHATIMFDEKSFIELSKGDNAFSFGRQSTAFDNHKSYANMGANLFTDTDATLNQTAVVAAGTTSLSTKIAGVGIQVTYSDGSDTIEATSESIASYALTYSINGVDLAYATATDNLRRTEQTFNVGTKFGALELRGQVMRHVEKDTASVDARLLKVGAKYSMGAIDLLGSYQRLNTEVANKDETGTGAMVVYNLSKRTSTYVGYNKRSGSGGAVDVTESTIGLQHKF
jgi:general bacterial porin, GBP family